MSRLAKGAWAIIVTMGVLASVELAARAAFPEDALLDAWERSDGWVAWEAGGPAPQPNRRDTQHDGPYAWDVVIDARGLRESPASQGAAGAEAPTRTLVALGDSWIFGNSVDQGHTIADVVEARLPGLEVLNAGLVGASAFDMVRRWHALGLGAGMDGVILGRPHNARRTAEVLGKRRAWYYEARPGPLLRARSYLLLRRWLTPWRGPRYAMPSRTDDAVEADLADLTAIVTDARSLGASVWFVAFPDGWVDAEGGGRAAPADPRWAAAMEALGVPVVTPRLPDRGCWGFLDLGHPSERGARVVGELVAAAIAGEAGVEGGCGE